MTIALKTKLSVLAVALMVAAAALLVPPATASAGEGAFALVGSAHLSDGIGSNSNEVGCLGGVATGVHGTDAVLPGTAANAFAGFTYNNPDTVLGDANGNLKIGDAEVQFGWLRVGAVAVVGFKGTKDGHTGHAVAAFAPQEPPQWDCNGKDVKDYAHGDWDPDDEHALVVGVGVISHTVPCVLTQEPVNVCVKD